MTSEKEPPPTMEQSVRDMFGGLVWDITAHKLEIATLKARLVAAEAQIPAKPEPDEPSVKEN